MQIECVYLNRDDRTDRRKHMDEVLEKTGWAFRRFPAEQANEALGFQNRRVRANWLSHEAMIEESIKIDRSLLILEDDVVISKPQAVVEYINQIKDLKWDVLYFYGADRLGRIQHVLDVHSYVVNKNTAHLFLERIRAKRRQIENEKPRDLGTFIDQYFAHVLQLEFLFWGTETLIFQDRTRFGSDTGWTHVDG